MKDRSPTVVRDIDGDEVVVENDQHGPFVCICAYLNSPEEYGVARLDARGVAALIADLSARLAKMLQQPAQNPPAPQERPVDEMSREEIRAELGFRGDVLDDLERDLGGLSTPATPRQAALIAALRRLAQKAGAI